MAKMVIHEPDEATSLPWPHATVLGFDPSMTNTGWAVVSMRPHGRPRLLTHGSFGTQPTGLGTSMRDNLVRMNQIHDEAKRVFRATESLGVQFAVMELPVPSRVGSASASGAMACTAVGNAVRALDMVYVHPTHSKKVTTGNGKAEKRDVKDFVKLWLDDPNWNGNQDIADAISAILTTGLDIIEDRFDYDEILEYLQ